MPLYRHPEATGAPDEITVIEDREMFVQDEKTGNLKPRFEFIDAYTIKAHPLIVEALIIDAERLWTLDEVLDHKDQA